VEQEIAEGKSTVERREGASDRELRRSRIDVLTGMFFSNLVMYFIILTAAATLHAHGQTTISTARDAAEALRPLAGGGAFWLFSLGLIGAGMLGVPVLAGSCAYAIAEAADWVGSLEVHPPLAHGFYGVIAVAMALGLGLNYAGLNAVKMLFWAAVLNGALAPPLLVLVVLLTSRADVMGERRNGTLLRWLGWMCAIVMLIATVIMFVTAAM
jgi:Mn2+/Fe2+ NRAMP family transporter